MVHSLIYSSEYKWKVKGALLMRSRILHTIIFFPTRRIPVESGPICCTVFDMYSASLVNLSRDSSVFNRRGRFYTPRQFLPASSIFTRAILNGLELGMMWQVRARIWAQAKACDHWQKSWHAHRYDNKLGNSILFACRAKTWRALSLCDFIMPEKWKKIVWY